MGNLRAAVRLVMFVVSTLGLYAFWYVTHFFVPNKTYWRQIVFGAWGRSFIWISNMKVECIGTPPRPPFFLVSNHLSYTDIAALRSVAKGVFVAKAEVSTWPVAGPIVRDMGTIFIDRANRRDIPKAGAKILERLDAGEGVIVFPEGTSTAGDKVLPFNSSFLEFAVKAGTPASYAAIAYRTPEGELDAKHAVCWWEDISFFNHLWRLFKVRQYTASISFGDEHVVGADRKQLAAELQEKVADRFAAIS
jgi:1-acyl-sn-glycerol-3-phosphate acyltransferase